MSTQPWEPRVSRLEGICEQVNHRLGTIELSVESLRQEMNASSESLRREMNASSESLRQEMNARFAGVEASFRGVDAAFREVNASFRWVVGMVLGGWLTTILAIFFHR